MASHWQTDLILRGSNFPWWLDHQAKTSEMTVGVNQNQEKVFRLWDAWPDPAFSVFQNLLRGGDHDSATFPCLGGGGCEQDFKKMRLKPQPKNSGPFLSWEVVGNARTLWPKFPSWWNSTLREKWTKLTLYFDEFVSVNRPVFRDCHNCILRHLPREGSSMFCGCCARHQLPVSKVNNPGNAFCLPHP